MRRLFCVAAALAAVASVAVGTASAKAQVPNLTPMARVSHSMNVRAYRASTPYCLHRLITHTEGDFMSVPDGTYYLPAHIFNNYVTPADVDDNIAHHGGVFAYDGEDVGFPEGGIPTPFPAEWDEYVVTKGACPTAAPPIPQGPGRWMVYDPKVTDVNGSHCLNVEDSQVPGLIKNDGASLGIYVNAVDPTTRHLIGATCDLPSKWPSLNLMPNGVITEPNGLPAGDGGGLPNPNIPGGGYATWTTGGK